MCLVIAHKAIEESKSVTATLVLNLAPVGCPRDKPLLGCSHGRLNVLYDRLPLSVPVFHVGEIATAELKGSQVRAVVDVLEVTHGILMRGVMPMLDRDLDPQYILRALLVHIKTRGIGLEILYRRQPLETIMQEGGTNARVSVH